MNHKSLLNTIYQNETNLAEQVQVFIDQGADLNSVTEYAESALRVASNNGRFDVVAMLLAAGADKEQLGWTDTVFEVAYGDVLGIRQSLQDRQNLEIGDFWERTPFLFAIQCGDIQKAALLLELGASRHAVGRCGKPATAYAIQNNHVAMLDWLLDQGFDIELGDNFGCTPIITAAELGRLDCLRLLIARGADIHKENHIPERAIQVASTLDIVRVLVECGDDINDISEEMHAALLGVAVSGTPTATKEEYLKGRLRHFGKKNPERSEVEFWLDMVRTGASAWRARETYSDKSGTKDKPIWTYQRYGRSTSVLPNGRVIEIGGEHEDWYDPDFCIYNDVTVFEVNGTINIYSYPESAFPPTDFHTATLVDNFIYIVGGLGYHEARTTGHTPVYRLDIHTFEIKEIRTSGDNPGWISRHRTSLDRNSHLVVRAGKQIIHKNGHEDYVENDHTYHLCLHTYKWKCQK